ncbi:MAG TPA: alkaline phosphatase family protein [Terriglobia bacterium]|nr:alkaline phosphatase family protein [Terriglobia bacterium]
MRRVGLALLLLVGLIGASDSFSQGTPGQPKLILVLSIDQMRFDYLTRFAPLYKGGLKMLLDRGAVFTEANYRHSATETGPGHSVILSGRHPSHSGIVANEWYDAYLHKFVNVVDDPVQTPLGGEGRSASPVNAISFTIGDVLKTKNRQSRVVGVSLKDRSAILMAGRRGDAAYWYETAGGNFITSTYYMSEAPRWLLTWNSRHVADEYAGRMWTRLLPDTALYERYAGPDNVDGEWDRKDTVFPHAIRGKPPQRLFYDDLRRTPFADEMTLSVALEAMKAHQLGEDSNTDIFAIGFSATDIVGHTYGADSQETMDQLLRLDLVLEKLFKEIDSKVGLDNTLVVLTADHGSLPLVENLKAKGIDAQRANPNVLSNAVKQALAQRFPGVDNFVLFEAPDFYFDEDAMRAHNIKRKDLEDAAIPALLRTGLVEKVYTRDDLSGTASSQDPFLPLFRNAFYAPRSPHLTVLLKKYLYLSSLVGGTGHGTAYDYDRHVPIVFMGAGVKPGTYKEACGPEDIAPTLALMLGLEFPREQDSRLLTEMLTQVVRKP